MTRIALSLLAGTLLAIAGCAEPESVTRADIEVSKGPDGEVIYLPRNHSTATSALAQYLQLEADFAGISKDGYFLDTQLANLHSQERLLHRAEHFHWRWQDLDGNQIDIEARMAAVKSKLEKLNVVG
ncbi:MAG: hypothetical protein MK116_11455 [Phycisphaerales bacterium]|nr:hypothetical protein [Phycisphaerales bacterium]